MQAKRRPGVRNRGRVVRRAFKVGEIDCEIDCLDSDGPGEATGGAGGAAVVLVPGQWSSKYDPLLMAIGEGVLRRNAEDEDGTKLQVVRMTFTTRWSEPFSGYHKEKKELINVISYLRGRMGLDVVGVVGHSKAASVVALAMSELNPEPSSPETFGVVCVSGRFNMAEGVERSIGQEVVDLVMASNQPQLIGVEKRQPFWLTKEMLEERASIDMGLAIKNMKRNLSRPEGSTRKVVLLVAHGDCDERIPVEAAASYVEAFREGGEGNDGEDSEIQLIRHADHCFTNPEHRGELVRHIVRFIRDKVLG
ncbi:prolyl oligopeptidase family domain-containing protein [Chloropicon primus]|nr:hypothetical protein A3770_07p46540 [Chloropicon primus]UPR01354.1 prolyl oligopeptidase family domain-containing protein [Chloropicon primus]|eukprot:QDZ22136.1 hypothetical protein A3770_07p46540 [Chloropicon primus]